jgi:hypothetical protein
MCITRVMKKPVISVSIALIAAIALSCDEKECCVNPDDESTSFSGQWILYERGFSPGSGYIIEPVSSEPAQIIELKGNGELVSTVGGLTDYKFYAVKGDIVGLFRTYPGPAPEVTTVTHSYHIVFEEGNLKLYFRYCVEGCHLGFKRLE